MTERLGRRLDQMDQGEGQDANCYQYVFRRIGRQLGQVGQGVR